jgi:hypothetical protein
LSFPFAQRCRALSWDRLRELGKMRSDGIVIASDSDAIQTKPQRQTLSLDGFAWLAMTAELSARTPQMF